ncbi:MAG TPA: hypothetical protein VGL71_01025 [Urbifossiella sp.]
MNAFPRRTSLFSLALALLPNGIAFGQDATPNNEPQVQARGPVHEAFARPDVTPVSPIVPKEPPAPIKELPPLIRPDLDGVQWIPGYWSYDDESKDYLWVSGTWRVTPPGQQWVPGSWAKAKDGWQWQHGFWGPTDPGGVKPFDAMPPKSLEAGPSSPSPNDDSFYTPGQWVFQNDEWVWQPGSWVPNKANMTYVPPQYLPNQNGSLYVPGYWDYPLQDRGMLFAPVAFGGSPYLGTYQPSYGVGLGGLLGSLFIGTNTGNYYFGNYYGNGYRSLGYVPWTSYGRRGYDPLLNYYSWANRGTPGWSNNLTGLYAGRLNGSLPVPAASYSQQLGAHPVLGGGLITANSANFTRNLHVNPINSLQTIHALSTLRGNQNLRLLNATAADLAARNTFATRQSLSRPVVAQQPFSGLHTPSLPGPAMSGLRPASSIQNFQQHTIRTQNFSPATRIHQGGITSFPQTHVIPQTHVLPRVQQSFHAVPAFHGGHIGGGHIGGGHMGGGHRR